jgi:hypothetical protein
LADSAADKRAAKTNKTVRVAVTFRIRSCLFGVLPKSFFFREIVGALTRWSYLNLDSFGRQIIHQSGANHRTTLVTNFALW